MNKVAIVTGANGGIGSVIALALGKNGFKVVLHYHEREERVKEIEHELGSENTLLVRADINNPTQVNKMILMTIEKFGRIDVLINNVGITRDSTFLKMQKDNWDLVINTNLLSIYNITKPVVEIMVKQGSGVIINISSIVGESGNFGQTNYSASKAGMIGFTKSLAKELASKGIRINAIAPGFIDTEMTRKIPENIKTKVLEKIPMKRFGEPEEISNVVLLLCNSTYITGAVLDINGGM
jgi:3-oxoacyl-(acyl-carrier-protein) reductase